MEINATFYKYTFIKANTLTDLENKVNEFAIKKASSEGLKINPIGAPFQKNNKWRQTIVIYS